MDFGNAWYNDHHFHYGYYIYAYAVLAAFDPKWGAKNLEHILVMVRDIANPSKDDHYFPVHRHKDWYMVVRVSVRVRVTHVPVRVTPAPAPYPYPCP